MSEEQGRLVELGLRRFALYRASSHRKGRPGPPRTARPAAASGSAPLGWRHDVTVNLQRSGGHSGRRDDPPRLLNARNNYFRGNWVFGDLVRMPGIEPFMYSEMLIESARSTFGRPHVVPQWLYVNILLPGQELAVHTDVPEFIGARRDRLPGWLLVTMHHSGLFEDRRVPVATAVTYVDDHSTGALYYYPLGGAGPAATIEPRRNTALIFDADTVFHGVDRTPGSDAATLLAVTSSATIRCRGGENWSLDDRDGRVAGFRTGELRFSLSWKAACFDDHRQYREFVAGHGELSMASIVERLSGELRTRGRLDGAPDRLGTRELAELMIDEFIPFPEPEPASVVRGSC